MQTLVTVIYKIYPFAVFYVVLYAPVLKDLAEFAIYAPVTDNKMHLTAM